MWVHAAGYIPAAPPPGYVYQGPAGPDGAPAPMVIFVQSKDNPPDHHVAEAAACCGVGFLAACLGACAACGAMCCCCCCI